MILEAMYNGEFYPSETVVPTSPEYRKAVQSCAALMEQLSSGSAKRTMRWWKNSGRRTLSPSARKARATSSMAFLRG